MVERFVRDSILDAREFEWESVLRFRWDETVDSLVIRQCTGSFGYGYEYMGLNGRLVITPLTDRIVLTLTQALTLYMGGAPAGPAGACGVYATYLSVVRVCRHVCLSVVRVCLCTC